MRKTAGATRALRVCVHVGRFEKPYGRACLADYIKGVSHVVGLDFNHNYLSHPG